MRWEGLVSQRQSESESKKKRKREGDVEGGTWPNGEWGYSTRRHMQELVSAEEVLPDRALCLPTFSHFLIVNKTSVSLSLSLSLSLTHTHTHIPSVPVFSKAFSFTPLLGEFLSLSQNTGTGILSEPRL
jgi:hypothetical protein